MPHAQQTIENYRRRTELSQRVWARMVSDRMAERHGAKLPAKARSKAKLLAHYEQLGLVSELLDVCYDISKEESAVY